MTWDTCSISATSTHPVTRDGRTVLNGTVLSIDSANSNCLLYGMNAFLKYGFTNRTFQHHESCLDEFDDHHNVLKNKATLNNLKLNGYEMDEKKC